MLDIHCPQMDRFAVDLIDAYRRREDFSKFPASHEAIGAAIEISRIHGLITAHRSQCPFCRVRAEAMQKRKSPVAARDENAMQRAG